MTLKNAINGFRIKDRYDQAFIEQGISTSEYYVFGTTKCSVMNLFKQLLNVIMWLFKQNIFKLRRIIEEVITYFSVMFSTAVTSDVCSPTSEFRLTVLPLVLHL
jgi:hypothetical protein